MFSVKIWNGTLGGVRKRYKTKDMGEKKISIEKIKAIVTMISMGVLAIQHFVGIFSDNENIAYVPLIITFLTIYITNFGEKKTKWICYISLIGVVLLAILGCIVYNLFDYGLSASTDVTKIYVKVVFGCIGVISLILSILQAKRIYDVTE